MTCKLIIDKRKYVDVLLIAPAVVFNVLYMNINCIYLVGYIHIFTTGQNEYRLAILCQSNNTNSSKLTMPVIHNTFGQLRRPKKLHKDFYGFRY